MVRLEQRILNIICNFLSYRSLDGPELFSSESVGENNRKSLLGRNMPSELKSCGFNPPEVDGHIYAYSSDPARRCCSASCTIEGKQAMVNPGSSSQPPPVTAGSLSWKRCAGCGGKIADRFLLYAMDSYWHSRCLKCSCCQAQLGDIGTSCYTKSGMILCRNDYIRLFGNSEQSTTARPEGLLKGQSNAECVPSSQILFITDGSHVSSRQVTFVASINASSMPLHLLYS
ncbi:LIM domain transcription factor LMO4 [Alligator mississippiensis]|uniref:LIM domain transcription factor LMO4 n=1 Tax=Alligator mississippiensis TaxID=8496 RepID=A0A151M571_ALLMI|nr:LIM domain transcription factor LMO4 [Alligator mississippiensis]